MNALSSLSEPEHITLRIEDFLVLEKAGAFDRFQKTELLDGEIFGVNSQFRPHSYTKFRLAQSIDAALTRSSSGLGVLVEATVAMPPDNLPDPDIVVTSEPRGKGFVPLASVALLVEVSDTTIAQDLRKKAAIYARNAVPEYWVVDLNAARIVRMWAPGPTGFAQADETPFGTSIASATIPGLIVATDALT